MTTKQHVKLDLAAHLLSPLTGLTAFHFSPYTLFHILPASLLGWVVMLAAVNLFFTPHCPDCGKRMRVTFRSDYHIGCGFSRTYYKLQV